jgi:hypothetical protein
MIEIYRRCVLKAVARVVCIMNSSLTKTKEKFKNISAGRKKRLFQGRYRGCNYVTENGFVIK